MHKASKLFEKYKEDNCKYSSYLLRVAGSVTEYCGTIAPLCDPDRVGDCSRVSRAAVVQLLFTVFGHFRKQTASS